MDFLVSVELHVDFDLVKYRTQSLSLLVAPIHELVHTTCHHRFIQGSAKLVSLENSVC